MVKNIFNRKENWAAFNLYLGSDNKEFSSLIPDLRDGANLQALKSRVYLKVLVAIQRLIRMFSSAK